MENNRKYNVHVGNIGTTHQLDLIRVVRRWNTMQNNKKYPYTEDREESKTCMYSSVACNLGYSWQLMQMSRKFALLAILVDLPGNCPN
jgi:hypothetical protein